MYSRRVSKTIFDYTIDIVVDSLRTCCGTCLKYTMALSLETIVDIPLPSNVTPHFIFPVSLRHTLCRGDTPVCHGETVGV